MKKVLMLTTALLLVGVTGFAQEHDPKVIVPLLKDSKISLLEGIEQAEKASGPAVSAKFEAPDGKLSLSIYTIPEGLGVEPAVAALTELSGDPTNSPFKPSSEVFADKEHIANATVHMTLFQLSKFSLKEVIIRALLRVPGTPIDVRNPMMRDKRPVADVVIAGLNQENYVVTIDLLNGKTKVTELK